MEGWQESTNSFSSFGAKLDAITDKVRSFFVAFCFFMEPRNIAYPYFNIFWHVYLSPNNSSISTKK